jgi:hypothetical protein
LVSPQSFPHLWKNLWKLGRKFAKARATFLDRPMNLWDQILARIETKVNRHSFYTWFRPTSFLAEDRASVTVRVPNPLFKDWLTKHYSGVITEAMAEVKRPNLALNFVADSQTEMPPMPPMPLSPDEAAALDTPAPLRECAVEQSGDSIIAVRLDEWTGPYPAIDYEVVATDFNKPEGQQYRSTVSVRRTSSRPFAEPVTVRLQTVAGADADLRWNSGGDVAIISTTTDAHVYRAIIDPDRKLIDDDRSNNAWPPRFQVVLDSADIEVSSTEFGFAALVVGRARYDYRKDLAVAGFYTNRGIGFSAGGRLHFGEQIDPSRFRQNLFGFYTFAALDQSFKNDSNPTVRTGGHLGGFGFRYDYTNVFWSDDPSSQRRFRVYADWYDQALGSDYSYMDWGYTASASLPLWTHRLVAAGQIFNGFSTAFEHHFVGQSLVGVPNQGLYSLGGSRSGSQPPRPPSARRARSSSRISAPQCATPTTCRTSLGTAGSASSTITRPRSRSSIASGPAWGRCSLSAGSVSCSLSRVAAAPT